ncbi:hypothetical protein ABK040_002615 [Willaertia magna]
MHYNVFFDLKDFTSLQYKSEFNIVFFGDKDSGILTVLSLIKNELIEKQQEIQNDYFNILVELLDGTKVSLNIFDVSTIEDEKKRKLIYKNAYLFIGVFDIDNEKTLINLKEKWFNEILSYYKIRVDRVKLCFTLLSIIKNRYSESKQVIRELNSEFKLFLDNLNQLIINVKFNNENLQNSLQSNTTLQNATLLHNTLQNSLAEPILLNFLEFFLEFKSIKTVITKIATICAQQTFPISENLSFIEGLDLNLKKTQDILRYITIDDCNELFNNIVKNYNEITIPLIKISFKNYKNNFLIIDIINKIITMHFIKIYTTNVKNNLFKKDNEIIFVFYNYLLYIIKNKLFQNNEDYTSIKLEMSSNQLSNFITEHIIVVENIMKNSLHLSINFSKLEPIFINYGDSNYFIYYPIKNLINYIKDNNQPIFENISSESQKMFIKEPYIINDKYIIVKLLGEGGFGLVFKAYDLNNYRFVALKIITTFESLNGFDREVDLITKIGKHLNIIEYLDYGNYIINNGTRIPYIVMELCDYSLNDKLFKNKEFKKEFNLKEKLNLFQQVCEGVEHLHLNNIIHRDLKLDNILIINKEIKQLNNLQNNVLDDIANNINSSIFNNNEKALLPLKDYTDELMNEKEELLLKIRKLENQLVEKDNVIEELKKRIEKLESNNK